ncbi:MAG: hypothetical protein HYT43_01245 [Candidatus Taylorbacteria bacterium]|nr:hypothetical protein [Candidatus Taylorbacteria bacterium]
MTLITKTSYDKGKALIPLHRPLFWFLVAVIAIEAQIITRLTVLLLTVPRPSSESPVVNRPLSEAERIEILERLKKEGVSRPPSQTYRMLDRLNNNNNPLSREERLKLLDSLRE